MSIASGTIAEVQTSGSDANSGHFNPNNSSMATDLVASSGNTSAPVVSSASYTFISRDVGHWLFIQSGGSYYPGWYKIASVSSGTATLDAAVGHGTSFVSSGPGSVTNVVGVGSSASLSGGKWAVDYSQSTPISFTDLVAVTTTTFTSSAKPIGKNFVGNYINVASGTGWTVTLWEVTSVSGTTGTAGNFASGTTIATAGSTGGTGPLGGPLSSPGKIFDYGGQQHLFIKYGTYTVTTTTPGSGGPVKLMGGASNVLWQKMQGYETYRGDWSNNRPTIIANTGLGACNLVWLYGTEIYVMNLIVDGNAQGVAGIYDERNYDRMVVKCKVTRCTYGIFIQDRGQSAYFCEVSYCTVYPLNVTGIAYYCYVHDCTLSPTTNYALQAASVINCVVSNGTGYGIAFAGLCLNNIVYNPSSVAFHYGKYGEAFCLAANNISYAPTASVPAFVVENGTFPVLNVNNAAYSSNGTYLNGPITDFIGGSGGILGLITLSGDPFNNAAAGDFTLNTGAGAAIRGAGYPGAFSLSGMSPGYQDLGACQHGDSTVQRTYIQNRRVR